MSHGPEHQIEHAEHAAHAVHDDFNRKVTISIAGIAALLACVTMLGHRAHNETLQLQNEAGRMATELPKLQKEAEAMVDKGKEFAKESHEAHKRADRFDYGELGLQLGVVLCSLAILTRSRAFLYVGLVGALIGCLVALTGVLGLFMDGH
jgi:Domain of unknown function (DUF4337)